MMICSLSELISQVNLSRRMLSIVLTLIFRLGLPALSFPVRVSSRGFPIGLQLIGPFMQDQHVLSIAHRICSTYRFPFLDLTTAV